MPIDCGLLSLALLGENYYRVAGSFSHGPTAMPRCVRASAVRIATAALLGYAASACTGDSTGPAIPDVATNITVSTGSPVNALVAIVRFSATADSVRVVYQATSGARDSTPFVAGHRGADSVIVLGVRPSSAYRLQVETRNRESALSPSIEFTSGALPAELQTVSLQRIAGVQSHYAATEITLGNAAYAVVFDTSGTIAWYHRFPGTTAVTNVVMQQNGNFTAFVGNTSDTSTTH